MTRMLIAGGCSWTSQFIYKKYGIWTWPHLVAEKMGLKLLNIGQHGASNDHIRNVLFDAMIEYKDDDPIVMVLWTDPKRANINDMCSEFKTAPEFRDEHGFLIDPEEYPYLSIKGGLRNIWMCRNLAEQFNLDYVDLLGCWYIPHKSTEQPEYQTTLSKIKKDWYFKKLGFNLREVEHGLTLNVNPISENDPHPNQENQEMFAEMMINKYNQRFVKPEYIYD